MSEVARLKSLIEARSYRRDNLKAEIYRKILDLKDLLAGYSVTSVEDLRLKLAAQVASEAAALQEEYIQCLREIEAAKKELG